MNGRYPYEAYGFQGGLFRRQSKTTGAPLVGKLLGTLLGTAIKVVFWCIGGILSLVAQVLRNSWNGFVAGFTTRHLLSKNK